MKNDLSGVELDLFFKRLFRLSSEAERQYYMMYVLVYLCGARAGPLPVGIGYEKRADMGNGFRRSETQTLRWSDCCFCRIEDGSSNALGVKVTRPYIKGYQQEFNRKECNKVWKICVNAGQRFEFDFAQLSALMTFERGPFINVHTIENLLFGSAVPVVDLEVKKEAVFVQQAHSNRHLGP